VTEVRAPQATYRGLADGRTLAFLGIPYAEPPTGPRRFRPPVPLRRGGMIQATAPGAAPPQIEAPWPDWMTPRTPRPFPRTA
jgi:para-nitrobenzyl esterase